MPRLICPTCGCSLVRLGIAPVPALTLGFRGTECVFCCAGCRDLFVEEPERYLDETADLDVCPVCLAEKPRSHAVRAEHAGQALYFCRCPHCLEEFHRRPDYYLDRLERRAEHPGVFGSEPPCCTPAPSDAIALQSTLSCPHCGHRSVETMPTDACLFFFECPGCRAMLRPTPGHCCVFCSYGSVPCPSVQSARSSAVR